MIKPETVLNTGGHRPQLLSSTVFEDDRGSLSVFKTLFPGFHLHQEMIVTNPKSKTLRGLHYQRVPYQQTKLLLVLSGSIFDVTVNLLTKEVSTFILSSNNLYLWVPKGYAHGYCTLQPHTTVIYKVDAPYSPEHEGIINPFDPSLEIPWPDGPYIISDRDRLAPNWNGEK